MKTVKLACSHALFKYLIAQKTIINGKKVPLFPGAFGIYGHGNVACIGQAMEEFKGGLTASFLMIGGTAVCFFGAPACITGGLVTGAVYSGHEYTQGVKRLSDATSCNITSGKLSKECSADVLNSIKQEVDFFLNQLNQALLQ